MINANSNLFTNMTLDLKLLSLFHFEIKIRAIRDHGFYLIPIFMAKTTLDIYISIHTQLYPITAKNSLKSF